MSFKQLTVILTKYRLTLDVVRLRTGNSLGGFYEFESTGALRDLIGARDEIRQTWGLPRSIAPEFCRVDCVMNPAREDYGSPYLCVTSFYTTQKAIDNGSRRKASKCPPSRSLSVVAC